MFKRLLLSTVVILVTVCGSLAQSRLYGRVAEIIDGKTVRLEMASGSIRAELQDLDVPEPEQPLHQLVRDHLKTLALGRDAEFIPGGLGSDRTVGQLFVNGVDVSAQMLRDGAAWLVPTGRIANPTDYAVYVTNETQARAEKRGVWSVPDLKPAWQFRAEKAEAKRQQEEAAWLAANRHRLKNRAAASNSLTPGRPQSQPEITAAASRDAWSQVIAGVGKEPYGLRTGYNEAKKVGWIVTSGSFVELSGGAGQKIECRAIYVYWENQNGTRSSGFAFAFRSLSAEYNFSRRRSNLSLVVDGRTINIGRPYGLRGLSTIGAHELMIYEVSKRTLSSIGASRNASVKIDAFGGKLPAEFLSLVKQLAGAT